MNWINYKGYNISDTGLVTKKNSNELQKLKIHNRGYVLCVIADENGKKWVLVHRLVATLFIPNPENKLQVNHKDGNKRNNCVSNLEWVTNAENRLHAVNNNLIAKGSILAKKLTQQDANNIRALYVKGSKEFGQYGLAKKYHVSQSLVMKILQNKIWKV